MLENRLGRSLVTTLLGNYSQVSREWNRLLGSQYELPEGRTQALRLAQPRSSSSGSGPETD